MEKEKELRIAYSEIVTLKNKIGELEERNEKYLKERDAWFAKTQRDREELELYYNNMIEMIKSSHEQELRSVRRTLDDMVALVNEQTKIITSSNALAKQKLFGRKSEKSKYIIKSSKKKSVDRDEEKSDFDGTGVSGIGSAASSDATSSASTGESNTSLDEANASSSNEASKSSASKDVSTLVAAESRTTFSEVYRELITKHPDAEISVRDYVKNKDYTDNCQYHSLNEYFTLGTNEYFVKRNNEVDINLVKLIIRIPERVEEHVYETATVRSADKDDYRTISTLELDKPIPNCIFNTDMWAYILSSKYCYNMTFSQIVARLGNMGMEINKSTLGDIVHRGIKWLREQLSEVWEKTIREALYWMLDETPLLVGCKDEDGTRSYKKRYTWVIRANILKLVWFIYEHGSRGAKAIRSYLDHFLGIYTTDGYIVYKMFDSSEEGKAKRSGCACHIRRYFVESFKENNAVSLHFIKQFNLAFAIEYECKKAKKTPEQRLDFRLKEGSTKDILASIKADLDYYTNTNYADCGPLLTKAIKYALSEWSALEMVLKSGEVELSNNLSEQLMRRIKMNLKTASNVGSEESAIDGAFMFSMIESCKINKISPEKYITYLLKNLGKITNQEELRNMLPCFCPKEALA